MDAKELELYQEENRLALIKMNEGLDLVKQELIQLREEYVAPPTELDVTVTNQQEALSIDNLEEVINSVDSLGKTMAKAIKENSYKPVDVIKVSNFPKQPEALKVSNLSDLGAYFEALATVITKNQPIVNISKQEVVFPTSPKQAIPVRLSDGKSFYNAIMTAVSSSGAMSFKDTNGNGVQVQLTAEGKVPIEGEITVPPIEIDTTGLATEAKQDDAIAAINEITAGVLKAGVDFDYLDVAQTSDVLETYSFKSGGSGGSTVQTIAITYAASDHNTLVSVEWS